MGESLIQRSFAGGELAPELHARADIDRYGVAAKTVQNFIVRRSGGLENRAGFGFVEACKTTDPTVRIYPFISATAGQSVLVEMGIGYFRFYNNGGRITVSGVAAWSAVVNYVPGDIVSSAGVNYYCHTANLNQAPPDTGFWYAMPAGGILEIPHPFGGNGLVEWNQSGNVVTMTSHFEAPRELVGVSLSRWILRTVSTAPSVSPPGGLSGTAGAAGSLNYAYVVTTAGGSTFEESNASGPFTIASCAEPTAAAPNTLTWTLVAGAEEYYVYLDPYGNGIYGFIGTAKANNFSDPGFIPDYNLTPPQARILFATTNNYPKYSSTHQQRRIFANTVAEPDGMWGSKVGFPSNFAISSPLQDDDAITFKIAGNNNHAVHGLISLKSLIALTAGGEWTIGERGVPLVPSNLAADQDTYAGIAEVAPVVVGNSIVYLQARASIVREVSFDQQVEGLAGKDLTIYASHLFEGKTIARMAYQQVPHSVIWCVRSDGVLLGLTYIPEQDVWGWHQHTTQQNSADGASAGVIEDVCVVPETTEDAVYVIVKRTIGGATVRYIERMERRAIRDGFFNADAFFVDSGMSYSGPAVGAVTGLDHLEGEIVAVLADGEVVFDGDPTSDDAALYTVTSGQIDLPALANNVHVGLPIRYADLELLDLDAPGTEIRDKLKLTGSVTLLVHKSSRSFQAGPDADHLTRYGPENWEGSEAAHTGQLELNVFGSYEKKGSLLIRQSDPLPITILGVIPNTELGG